MDKLNASISHDDESSESASISAKPSHSSLTSLARDITPRKSPNMNDGNYVFAYVPPESSGSAIEYAGPQYRGARASILDDD